MNAYILLLSFKAMITEDYIDFYCFLNMLNILVLGSQVCDARGPGSVVSQCKA